MKIVDVDSAVAFLTEANFPFESPDLETGTIVVEKVCPRCGGSGSFAYCEMHGTDCFQCIVSKANPPKWKARVDAIEHAREMKRRLADRARQEREHAEAIAREEAEAERVRTRVPVVVEELAKELEAMVGLNGWVSDFKASMSAIDARRRVENIPLSVEAEVPGGYEFVAFRDLVKEAIRLRKYEAGVREEGGHVGEVGKRMTVELTLAGSRSYDTAYGTKYAVSFVDAHGQKLIWFASLPLGREVPRDDYTVWEPVKNGEQVKVKATVKYHNHDRYGAPQTVLTRVVLA